ncbi:MAG: T9SS type A sorting domain-containing protein [Saprospiraceae bacterium]|nr:T9SS type A sorting domain-containing protein [Candidatus Brachybacter algidus]
MTIYSSEKMSKYKFRLYSIYGCRIDVRMESNTLDISQLNDGVYFLEVEYGNRRITKKIIKRSI